MLKFNSNDYTKTLSYMVIIQSHNLYPTRIGSSNLLDDVHLLHNSQRRRMERAQSMTHLVVSGLARVIILDSIAGLL